MLILTTDVQDLTDVNHERKQAYPFNLCYHFYCCPNFTFVILFKVKHKIRINQFFEQKKAEDACIIPYSFSEFKRKTNGIFGGMREIV